MRKFYIVTNAKKDPDFQITKRICEYLTAGGCRWTVQDDEQLCHQHVDIKKIPSDTECILVLGGDGTLIRTAGDVVALNIPLLGINLGTLGYLAEVERSHLTSALDALMADQCEVEERMMLKGTVHYADGSGKTQLALNDIVITRSGSLHLLKYRIFVNGELLCTYGADGIIVSTPTGSTGYSLSAGGPIVSPKAKMILITPICPHTLNLRSILLSSEDQVTVETVLGSPSGQTRAVVSCDGADEFEIHAGDRVCICAAKESTKILKINKESFLETLRRKMGE